MRGANDNYADISSVVECASQTPGDWQWVCGGMQVMRFANGDMVLLLGKQRQVRLVGAAMTKTAVHRERPGPAQWPACPLLFCSTEAAKCKPVRPF
jgi:hypothetical protein